MPSFLDGARKEAKELLAKFNARDESRSLLPVDGANRAIKRPVIHRFPIRSILRNFAPARIFTVAILTQGGYFTNTTLIYLIWRILNDSIL